MPKHLKLFIPGPGDVDEEVLAEMARPVLRHYGPEWMEIYHETLRLLKQIFMTENDIFIVPGAASTVSDLAIASLAPTGSKMVIGLNGFFGGRLLEIAQGYGINVVPFNAPLGQPLDPDALRSVLQAHPDAKVVALVHHETGTTVLNPLRELAAVVRSAGRVLIADAVSSMGGVPCPVDAWGIDVCISGANKCLEALPGVSFLSVGRRAWEIIDSLPNLNHGWYSDLRVWRKFATEWGSWHPTPVTLPVNVILAVTASMRRIMKTGLEAHYARYAHASQAVRAGLRNLGYEMFVPDAYAAPIATGIKARPEFEVAELSRWLIAERSIVIGGGLGELSGKMFRIGHLGKAAEREYLLDFLFAMEEFLRYKGIPVPEGASLVGL
jgi:alanine-glyoxylate transaminase / serine-glyoxylate transaminase / serine-pyruvate transaminase